MKRERPSERQDPGLGHAPSLLRPLAFAGFGLLLAATLPGTVVDTLQTDQTSIALTSVGSASSSVTGPAPRVLK